MIRYISIKQILDDLLDHPLLQKVTLERAINYTVQFIRIVGMPRAFKEVCEIVPIDNYRGKLPCDLDNIIQVRYFTPCHRNETSVLRYSTDSFHMSSDKGVSQDLTYKVEGNFIFTSMKHGEVEISYNALAVDDEGYPLIPDSSSFIRALELYIKKQVFCVLFETNEISPQVYHNVCQEYAFAVGQAHNDLVRPTADQMESITNMMNTLIPRVREHSKGFIDTGTREKIKLQ